MNNIRRLAVVPARGGSKRIKGKNIRLLNGLPIIIHTLRSIKQCELFNEIHVSTDCDTTFQTVSEFGFLPRFKREEGLADDFTGVMPVLRSVVAQYAKIKMVFDEIWLVMPCSPLLEPQDYKEAAVAFRENKKKPLLAITEFPVPIEWAFDLDDVNQLHPRNPGMFSVRSQDIKQSYYDAGLFSVYSWKHLKDMNDNGTDEGFIGFKINKTKAIDIDEEMDWYILEALFEKKLGLGE
ncbi:acylneuraminate cytidylyltransferase family protein [Paracoccaceae bacterium]|nr:acylneuraminate cytidylyltransferase family protein [Paracoccaceae bacterium]